MVTTHVLKQVINLTLVCALSLSLSQPLNPNPESSWHRYFKDNDIIVQIDNDTR